MLAIVAAAVALKVAVVAPATTVIEAGTVSRVLLLLSARAAPPAGALVVKVAEQIETWPPFRLPGAHVIVESAGTAMMPPAVVNAARLDPLGETPIGFDIPIEVVVALGVSVNWTLATIPAATAFAFGPLNRQVREPGTEPHSKVFPAVDAASPAVTPIAEI